MRRPIGAIAVVVGIVVASLTFVIAPARALAAGGAVVPNSAFANFTDVVMQPSDDGSWPDDSAPQVFPFGFNINYFGAQEPGAYVNNNGNLTFTGALSSFTPFGLPGATTPIIAPFFADVETYNGNTVNIGTGTLNGFKVFVANWPGVQCYPESNTSVLDNFQVILVDRPDLGTGINGDDFQIEFNYDSIQWDAGGASGGDANCTNSDGPSSAAAGYSDGSQTAGHYYQLPGSQSTGAFLDSNTTSGLIYNELNSDTATSVPPSITPVLGRYIFNVQNGQPISPTTLITSLSGGGSTGTSITVLPNTPVTNSATLPGANTATAGGTVTYGVYSDNACTTLVVTGGTVTVTNGIVPDSNPVVLAGLGTYYWLASYSGDALDDPSTNSCSEVETVALPPATVSTNVVDPALGSAWNDSETTSASANDTSTVSGSSGTPTGSVTYSLFANLTCAGAASTTETVTLAAGAVPDSSGTAPLAPGPYSFAAAYSGDSNYAATDAACEPFTVDAATMSTGTVVEDAALGSAWNGNETTGSASYDTVALTAIPGFIPTGTVTYELFSNSGCTGVATTTETVTLNGGAVPDSTSTGALAAAAYGYDAAYSGDADYAPSTGSCEPFSVLASPSGVGTVVDDASSNAAWDGSETPGAAAYDTATVSKVAGINPTGTLTYSLYANGTCSGSPSTTSIKTLSGGVAPDSTATAALAAGSYGFTGSYSGDSNYLAATGSCEPFAVLKTTTTFGTIVDDAGTSTAWAGTETVGATAYDTASVTAAGGFTPAGTVTYRFFTNGTCAGAPAVMDTVTLSAGNVPHSATTGALTSGPHGFDATYSGDGNYQAASAGCATFSVLQAPLITSGDATSFTINVPGTFTVTTTGYPGAASMQISDNGAVLPSGVTFLDNGDGTATLAGTPATGTSGIYPITISATNAIAPDATQSFTLTVGRPPAITTANAATFKAGTFATFEIDSNGFPGAGSMVLSDGGATLPAGVGFVDNGDETATLSGTAAAGTGGVYTFTITASNGVAPDATQPFTLTIDEPPSVTSANGVTFAIGAAGTFTVTMSGFPSGAAAGFSDGGANLPSGVSFVDNNNGTATLAGTPAAGTIGSYPFTITVANGIGPNGTQAFVLTVVAAGTTSVLSSPTNPSVVGQSVTLIASVSVTAPSSGAPTGTVRFDDGGSPITACTSQPLSSGTASCVIAFATAAVHPLTATYSGDADFASSTSASLPQTVGAAATAISTASSANPAVTGQTVVYTAGVSRTAPSTGSAVGTVTFTDNGTPISGCVAVTVNAGLATCTVTYPLPGTHSIIATFNGDADDLASTAPALTEQVQLDPTVTTVTSAPNPSTVGDMVTITVTVKAASPGSGNPTGTVTILVDGKAAASVALDSHVDSRAVYSLSSLAVGVHAITATYNGDFGYAGSSAVVADSQSVVPVVAVPVTGNVSSGWAAIAALGLVINGLALIAWTRRRRRL